MNKTRWYRRLGAKLSILGELFSFLWKNRLWWMMPIVIIFVSLGILIWFTQSAAVVPFIYALF